MKYIAIILLATLLAACKPSTAGAPKEVRMPANDLVKLLKDHLPKGAVSRVESTSTNEDQFDLELTTEEFKHLQHVFTNKVEEHARTAYSYDRFTNRTTTEFTEGFSSFSVSLGKGRDYHYIIIGSFVLVEDRGKAVIWIKPTQG